MMTTMQSKDKSADRWDIRQKNHGGNSALATITILRACGPKRYRIWNFPRIGVTKRMKELWLPSSGSNNDERRLAVLRSCGCWWDLWMRAQTPPRENGHSTAPPVSSDQSLRFPTHRNTVHNVSGMFHELRNSDRSHHYSKLRSSSHSSNNNTDPQEFVTSFKTNISSQTSLG